ncbi:putative retrotransposon hot spot protein (RHS) [Trypanosoma cruzi]|uniref:Putative retrotransposon hot spot protein (RHS) n=1 Tax=Trypanosoma cruzi TaxID=5693 RepID=A0A2V2WZY4_TRYCR|nr:putative retrotransposon hot spot protein (RHS) [Trypanosoma cruzi]RNC36531.1 retrotransposon hot spot (RHS) protein [Trypanosoma cruzi]
MEYHTNSTIKHRLLCIPAVGKFLLVDAFFFVDSNPVTLVGLRVTTAGGHHIIASTVRQFTECLAAYFNGWEELSRDMSWEIIYVQRADRTPMNGWQRRGVVNLDSVSDDESREIAGFWREEMHQYQVSISSGALEETQLSEVRNSHGNGKRNWGGKGEVLISGKK